MPSATLAVQTFSDLKASLAVPPLKEDDLKEATLEQLDDMISSTHKKLTDGGEELKEMIKERDIKRAMREEQEKLEVEERVLREKMESLRERTMEGLKRKRRVVEKEEGMGDGKGGGGEEDIEVKKEKLDVEDGVAQKNDTAENNVAEKKDDVSEDDELSEVSEDSDDSVDWYGF